MNNRVNLSIKETVSVLSNIVPVVFSMAVCAGMGAFASTVFACLAALICTVVEEKQQMPLYVSLLVITYTFKEFGASTAALSIVICGILLATSALFYKKIKNKLGKLQDNPIVGAVMLSCALTVTVLFTTDYFGIGATGNTAKEMISSYLSLGFHPNWRGVLYGTIVMVIMITFPRKFKKATKVVSAAFIALIFTTVLNLFLNPSDMITAIREAGTLSFNEYKSSILLPVLNSKPSVLFSLFSGTSLFITYFYMIIQNKNCKKSDFITCGILNCIFGFGTCMPIPNTVKKNKVLNGVLACVLTGIIFFVFHDFIARIPVHSCAVVIIVGAWQSVKWSKVKKIFSSVLNIFIFVCILVFGLFGGYHFVPISALVAFGIYSYENNLKRIKTE